MNMTFVNKQQTNTNIDNMNFGFNNMNNGNNNFGNSNFHSNNNNNFGNNSMNNGNGNNNSNNNNSSNNNNFGNNSMNNNFGNGNSSNNNNFGNNSMNNYTNNNNGNFGNNNNNLSNSLEYKFNDELHFKDRTNNLNYHNSNNSTMNNNSDFNMNSTPNPNANTNSNYTSISNSTPNNDLFNLNRNSNPNNDLFHLNSNDNNNNYNTKPKRKIFGSSVVVVPNTVEKCIVVMGLVDKNDNNNNNDNNTNTEDDMFNLGHNHTYRSDRVNKQVELTPNGTTSLSSFYPNTKSFMSCRKQDFQSNSQLIVLEQNDAEVAYIPFGGKQQANPNFKPYQPKTDKDKLLYDKDNFIVDCIKVGRVTDGSEHYTGTYLRNLAKKVGVSTNGGKNDLFNKIAELYGLDYHI